MNSAITSLRPSIMMSKEAVHPESNGVSIFHRQKKM